MNQAKWKALVEHHDHVSKTFTPRKAEAGFKRNLDAVLSRIPEPDRSLLEAHWRMEKEAIDPFDGKKYPAPLFMLDSDFIASGMKERASAMAPCAKSNCYPGGGIVVPKGCYPSGLVLS